jgi:hypothetical protein
MLDVLVVLAVEYLILRMPIAGVISTYFSYLSLNEDHQTLESEITRRCIIRVIFAFTVSSKYCTPKVRLCHLILVCLSKVHTPKYPFNIILS